ncbi:MAG: MHYT domain-containing protein [Gammaproteobacteria bacterium]
MNESFFDPLLVSLSLVVAVVASYTALELARRVASSTGTASTYWLVTGAVSMGIGIWSMHFVGMLAFKMDMPFSYNVPLTSLSLLIGMAASAFAIYVGSRSAVSKLALVSSGLILGAGIAGMHYTGMEAMEMQAEIVYDRLLVLASIVIAFVSATAAIFIALTVANTKENGLFGFKLVAACIMGIGICGMHYTGMYAASYVPIEGMAMDHTGSSVQNDFMAVSLAIAALVVLGITHLTMFFDYRMGVQKKLGEKAEQEAMRLAKILDDSINEIYVVDPKTNKFTSVNKGAVNNLGYTREQLLQMGPADINPFLNLPADGELTAELAASPNNSKQFETMHQRANGETYPVQIQVQLSQSDDEPVLIAVVADITERKALELQVSRSKKLESIGQLAAGIAHEINTPAQFVGDNTRFLQDSFGDLLKLVRAYDTFFEKHKAGTLGQSSVAELELAIENADAVYLAEEVPTAIEQSIDGVKRISNIVLAMREFSHPGSADKELVDLSKTIANTITVASNEWKYVAKVHTEFITDLPLVRCYPQQISQVVLNLIVNAAHAIHEKNGDATGKLGTITVSTQKKGEMAEIRVTDTGCGIPDENRDRIFDPFFTTKEVGIGSGQGLAMAYATIVDGHRGELNIESDVGKGTTFIIRIPINPMEQDQEAVAA